ncbi:hypothetical protein [Psychrobacter sp. GP33]|nr:hypothetical protein [Psychrobacter sp. GP33]
MPPKPISEETAQETHDRHVAEQKDRDLGTRDTDENTDENTDTPN